LAIRNHLPLAECAHFGQHRTAQALYDAFVARYSSPATAALGRLLLPYQFPELFAFATVEDLVSHLRTGDARYCAAAPAEFLDRNQPQMFITLYFIVTRLPDSLRSVRDHFLSLDPTTLTIDLLEQHLLAAETSVVAVGAARGTPRTPFFEGCSPSPLAPSYASAAAVDVPGAVDVGAASASVKRRSGKGKGGRGGRGGSGSGGGGSGGGGGGSGGVGGGSGGGGSSGSGDGSGGFGGGGGGSGGSGGSGGGGRGGGRTRARGIDAGALGASESVLPSTAPAEALHTFTLDSGASRCFFRDSTNLTPLSAPVPVRLADPSGGPVVAGSSTVLPCPAVPSGSLSGLHLSLFSINLVSTAALQDAMVTTTTPGGQRVSICTCTQTGRHLATFTRRPGSSMYTLATKPPQTLLWHHRLGHPSLPRLYGMHSHLLVSGLPRSLPPLPPSPAPPCLPCVEGRQRAAPHSSSFPPMTAPLQTLHMDVWGPARVSGKDHERYFLLVVDDYTRYTTVFLLRSKGQGILQSFTLSDSPQQNGIAERCIGLVMEVVRTSMIHVAAPHFLWPFAVWYAAHQLNLFPLFSFLETSPTLRWTGKVGDASMFRVLGSRAFVRDTSADKLSARAIPCVFLGFTPDAPSWQFYHPTLRRVFPSQDVTFDESVPFYRLFPYRSAPPPTPPLFLAPGPPPVDPLAPQGPAPSGVSQVDPLSGTAPVEVSVGSGVARVAVSGGAASGGGEPWVAETDGAGSGGAAPGGEEPEGAEPGGVALSGGSASASPRLSPQQLREWLVRRACLRREATGAGGAGGAGARGAGVTVRVNENE
ncbi:unnamed protein product, partial [Closterium sp. NIES-53]